LIFYIVSLRFTTSLFRARREELMALMEGRVNAMDAQTAAIRITGLAKRTAA